jgi:hypothetical protein
MVESDTEESSSDQASNKHPRDDPYAVYDLDYASASVHVSKNPKIDKLRDAEMQRLRDAEMQRLRDAEENLPPLRNTKLGFRQGQDISACILGPDFGDSEAYRKMLIKFGGQWDEEQKSNQKLIQMGDRIKILPNTPADNPYEAFKVIKKNIEDLRSGKVRCNLGPYKISEFPRYDSRYHLQLNKRLKFVVVKDFHTKKFIILMSYAYMPNHNYTEDYLLKWTHTNADGTIRVRTSEEGPKIVIEITPRIIPTIEAYWREVCRVRQLDSDKYLEWDSLLMTRSFKPALYKEIIEQYFSEVEGVDLKNTAFLTSIDEISHSALANNFAGRGKKLEEDSFKIPLVFLGAEGVFYTNAQGKQCFIICNLSGHFKTPKERMDILRLILKHNYGYVNEDGTPYEIRELEPIPLASASSSSSQDSDERRPDYRDCLTNDPNIRNFLEALAILNRADTTPIQGEVYTPYSAPTAHFSYRHALASSPPAAAAAALAAAAPFEVRSSRTAALASKKTAPAASAVNSRSSRAAASAVNSRSSRAAASAASAVNSRSSRGK